ncbi:hypothetical protein I3842_14G097500 [Carya illinoinensis]|uniref:Uncharacterized protein n=1 Tax=Carya illinoinensis TaxID=32201 RepID=A0A922D4G6_CARIL|nr:hypothetical protein I3842_14G097500 [Carya illinoinensis]
MLEVEEVSENVANCLISGILPNSWLNERLRTDRKIRPSASCKGISPVSSLLDKSSDSRWLNFPKDDGIRPVKTLFDKLRTFNNLSSPNSSGIGPMRLLYEKSIQLRIVGIFTNCCSRPLLTIFKVSW